MNSLTPSDYTGELGFYQLTATSTLLPTMYRRLHEVVESDERESDGFTYRVWTQNLLSFRLVNRWCFIRNTLRKYVVGELEHGLKDCWSASRPDFRSFRLRRHLCRKPGKEALKTILETALGLTNNLRDKSVFEKKVSTRSLFSVPERIDCRPVSQAVNRTRPLSRRYFVKVDLEHFHEDHDTDDDHEQLDHSDHRDLREVPVEPETEHQSRCDRRLTGIQERWYRD